MDSQFLVLSAPRTTYTMVSKVLMGVWAALDVLLLAAGAVSIALSIVWGQPNVLMNMVLSKADLTGMQLPSCGVG